MATFTSYVLLRLVAISLLNVLPDYVIEPTAVLMANIGLGVVRWSNRHDNLAPANLVRNVARLLYMFYADLGSNVTLNDLLLRGVAFDGFVYVVSTSPYIVFGDVPQRLLSMFGLMRYQRRGPLGPAGWYFSPLQQAPQYTRVQPSSYSGYYMMTFMVINNGELECLSLTEVDRLHRGG